MKSLSWLSRNHVVGDAPRRRLAADQKEHSPIKYPDSPLDYGQRLYLELKERIPNEIRQLFDRGVIAIGEVGILSPNSFVEPLHPSGYVIEIYTGLPQFLYEVSRALHARTRVLPGREDGETQEITVGFNETTEVVSEIFHGFMDKAIIARPQNYHIADEQIRIASALATHAETFFVAHEIGHILVWRLKCQTPQSPSFHDEFEADKYAFEFLLGLRGEFGAMNGLSQRMVYAGIEFGLRVYAGLEHLGYKFEKTHPAASDRIKQIRSTALTYFGRRGFLNLSTIAFGYDQLLEAVEKKLASPDSQKFVLGVTSERVLSSLMVMVEKCARNEITIEFAITELLKILSEASDTVIRIVAKEAVTMFFLEPLVEGTSDQVLSDQIQREMFREIVQDFPEGWRKVFIDTYSILR